MNKQQAQEIIKKTFESSFDKRVFTVFIKNLLNRIDEAASFIYQGNYISNAYKQYIKTMERIGKFSDGENSIDILVITLQKETSLEHARTMQRNFIARYLSRRGQRDAALVAFVSPGKTDWRFSLVKMDYKFEQTKSGRMKVKEEFTPARRWSFLVGENEKSHTAQSRLVRILKNDEQSPTLKEIEEAFDIETVTKEFFLKYRELFLRTKEELDKVVKKDVKVEADFDAKGVDTVNFAKKLLGQIVFLYFLQKKGWFGAERNANWDNGSKHFLRELFEKKHGNYNNFFNGILEPLFYEALRIDRSHDNNYYSQFRCKIPFLNGGLFDPIDNYDWEHTDIHLPDSLFSNQNKTKEGDIGDGILDIFDRYNFTVKEDEPLEKEVAIDPELLGKIYEKFNAIRPDNFEEYKKALKSDNKGDENKFNKQFGVYYTPREIVHYMCQLSLINYLATELEGMLNKEDIEILIHNGEHVRENEEWVISEGKETKTYSHKLPASIRENASLIDDKLADITVCDPASGSGAFPVGMMNEIVKMRDVLSKFIQDEKRPPYTFKRRCIEHSLYGVDIDPGAVEIAKLRLWLSLVVDEDDIKNIKPLPNLDYKIVCGNSLIGYPHPPRGLEHIEKLKERFFEEVNPKNKNKLRSQINDAIYGLFQITEKSLGYKVTMDFKINFSEVFHEKGGFDIVIGNPPYVQLQKDKGKLANMYKNCRYKTFERTGDIYVLFYENGINILKKRGHLCFITSNKWMRARYGESLKEYFLAKNPLLLIDLGPDIFENATVDTNILIIQNDDNNKTLRGITLTNEAKDKDLANVVQKNAILLPNMNKNAWFIGSNAEQKLKEKIERIGIPLKEWNVNINYGIKTGLNEAFIIDTETKKRLCKEDPKSAEILKPILRGRDINRYNYDWAGLWIIASGYDINVPKLYPAVYKHLLQFKEKAKKRDDQGQNWWNLRSCAYYPEFKKEKVVWQEMSKEPTFSYDNQGVFCNDTGRILTGKYIKLLIGVFNTRFFNYSFSNYYAGGGLGEKGVRYKSEFMKDFPIPRVTPQNRPIVEEIQVLVEQILTDKKQDKDTGKLEQKIDLLVSRLYDLTEEEIGYFCPKWYEAD